MEREKKTKEPTTTEERYDAGYRTNGSDFKGRPDESWYGKYFRQVYVPKIGWQCDFNVGMNRQSWEELKLYQESKESK